MQLINLLMNRLFDFFLLPFRSLSAWVGLIFISLLTGLLMLFIFRWTSNQAGIRKVKDKIKAHLLELRLFKDSMEVTLSPPVMISHPPFRQAPITLCAFYASVVSLSVFMSSIDR